MIITIRRIIRILLRIMIIEYFCLAIVGNMCCLHRGLGSVASTHRSPQQIRTVLCQNRKSSLLLVSRLQTYSNHPTPVLLDQHRPVYTNDFEVGRAPIPELDKGISKVTFNEVRSVLCPPALC